MPVQNRRIKRGWMNLKVSRVTQESPDTKTYYLIDAEDGGRQFDYIPGQYLTFRFDHIGPKPIVRSYTMSSSPNQKEEVAKIKGAGAQISYLLEKELIKKVKLFYYF